MSGSVFHSIATQIRDRYLQPLQFPGSRRSVEQRVSDLENAKNGQQPANSRIKIRVKGQGQQSAPAEDSSMHARVMSREGIANGIKNHADIQRVREDHSSSLDAWHAQHSSAASDLLHTFNARMNGIQAQSKPSGGAWDDFHAAFGTHAATSGTPVQSAPQTPPPAAKPQRVVQAGLFGPSQVRSPQQFGMAASPGPRQKPAVGAPAAKKPRVTQPGLFPKSAVQPPK
jgi:hypothetical protein